MGCSDAVRNSDWFLLFLRRANQPPDASVAGERSWQQTFLSVARAATFQAAEAVAPHEVSVQQAPSVEQAQPAQTAAQPQRQITTTQE
jgi:hypothetical protein